jgi:hypothetical protein
LRRAAHEVLTPQACQRYLPIQEAEAAQLSYELLTNPAVSIFYLNLHDRKTHDLVLEFLHGDPPLFILRDALHIVWKACSAVLYKRGDRVL